MYIERNGPHTVGSIVSGNIKQLNIDFQYNYVNISNAALREAFNASAMCGITNWPLGSDTNVSGQSCAFSSETLAPNQTFPSGTSSLYTIFEIMGFSTLYLGDPASGNGSTPAQRPTAPDNTKSHIFDGTYYILPSWVSL